MEDEWFNKAWAAMWIKSPSDHPQADAFLSLIERAREVLRTPSDEWLSNAEMNGSNVLILDYRQHQSRGVPWMSWRKCTEPWRYRCGKCGYDFGLLGRDQAALRGLVTTGDLCSDCANSTKG